MKAAIFILAYDEEKTVGRIARLARRYGTVFVIDDGSQDRTCKNAIRAGASVIRHGKNLGYGAALRTGVSHAKKIRADAAVFLDGDGQHNPNDVPRLIAPIAEGRADICLGSRYLGRFVGAPILRRAGIAFINTFACIAEGSGIIDCQCGFRALSKRALCASAIKSDDYPAGMEMLFSAKKNGMRLIEVPLSVRYFGGDDHWQTAKHGAKLAKYIAGRFLENHRGPLAMLFALFAIAFLALTRLKTWG